MAKTQNNAEQHYTDYQDLQDFCKALFDRSNLMAGDFKDISAIQIKRTFAQGSTGVRFTFDVSDNAIGKVTAGDTKAADAHCRLLRLDS